MAVVLSIRPYSYASYDHDGDIVVGADTAAPGEWLRFTTPLCAFGVDLSDYPSWWLWVMVRARDGHGLWFLANEWVMLRDQDCVCDP